MVSQKKYILINRGFSGTYLEKKLGHELINFVADDRGRQWCFANKDGFLAFDKYGKVDWVINVILVRRGVFEVLNALYVEGGHLESYTVTSEGLVRLIEKNLQYAAEQDIRFGGTPIGEIFDDMNYITFRASNVYLPKKRVILSHEDLSSDPLGKDSIQLEMAKNSSGESKQLGNQSPKTYVSNKDKAFNVLLDAIHNPNMFKKGYQYQFEDIVNGYSMTFCEKDSETVNLAEYLKQKNLFIRRAKRE